MGSGSHSVEEQACFLPRSRYLWSRPEEPALRRQLPKIIEEVWYAFDWDAEDLWALELRAEHFPLARLEWMLDIPAFGFEGRDYCLSPREILRQPYRYAAEYRRVQTADLVFPIEIIWLRRRWVVLDGMHRMMKAHEAQHTEIMVRKVPRTVFGL